MSWIWAVAGLAIGGIVGFFLGRRSPSEEREHMAMFLENVVAPQAHDKKLLRQIATALRNRNRHV